MIKLKNFMDNSMSKLTVTQKKLKNFLLRKVPRIVEDDEEEDIPRASCNSTNTHLSPLLVGHEDTITQMKGITEFVKRSIGKRICQFLT